MAAMTIALLVNEFWPAISGSANSVLGHARLLTSLGHRVTVLTSRDITAQLCDRPRSSFPLNEQVDHLTIRRVDLPRRGPLWTYRSIMHLLNWLRQFQCRFDMIIGVNL